MEVLHVKHRLLVGRIPLMLHVEHRSSLILSLDVLHVEHRQLMNRERSPIPYVV